MRNEHGSFRPRWRGVAVHALIAGTLAVSIGAATAAAAPVGEGVPDDYTDTLELPGAEALDILRDDFDAWGAPSALAALAALYGRREPAPTVHLHPAPAFPCWRMKALSRIHLPAPPTH